MDGVWWPRSRDLFRELPALTDVLDDRWGRVTRVTVNPACWPVIPRTVPVTGRTVTVGRFMGEQHPHELVLLSHTAGRWDLLVIPPETTGAEAAAWLLSAGAAPGSPLTADRLMAYGDATRAVADPPGGERKREARDGVSSSPLPLPTGFPLPARRP
ncbi:MAG TPA: DUF5994 family protein [Streptomyces sp.]|uniref:DUF5994 family protein n=1 Tax=Streptomyces sp. TaxID=1931 RepID=UPI002D73FB38|nr:DUF5994 family protein [Streptomyces sp.]HZG03137.1 DUF5994 family protein [Streptomyces sp.]